MVHSNPDLSENKSTSELLNVINLPQSFIEPKADYSHLSNEVMLFILNTNSGLAPYSHEFITGGQDPQILSGFISAMSSFMGEVTGKHQAQWKTVYGGQTTLLVEGGTWAVGVLAVIRETNEARSKLRFVVKEFEDAFVLLQDAEYSEGGIFTEFDHFVRRIFVTGRISEDTVILKGNNWTRKPDFELPSWNFRIRKFVQNVQDHQSLREIAREQNLKLEDAKEIASRSVWNGNILLLYVPTMDDVLLLSHGASSIVFDTSRITFLSKDTLKVLGSLNGRTPLSQILKYKDVKNSEIVQLELGYMMNLGFVQKISLERLFVLINEDVLSNITRVCGKAIGLKRTRKYLEQAISNSLDENPWVSRVVLSGSLRAKCIIEDGVTPFDLDLISNGLETLQKTFLDLFTSKNKSVEGIPLLKTATEKAQNKWRKYVRDEVFF